MLINDNKTLVDQCSNLKTLMVSYEKESMYHRLESNVSLIILFRNMLTYLLLSQFIFEELAKENDSLKRLLLINHDFTDSIEERMREVEKEEQERKY